jgi:NADH:ubiquinone oxidoreductase subunit F (NADH-binding)/NAD-dependent dihydropyrimidine dehydrogenase PreA subunit
MAIAAYAIGANKGYVYVRAEYPLAVERLATAIRKAKRSGFLGSKVAETQFAFEVEIHLGAGAFVCGEETAQLCSIEGRRGMPRSRPPFPAQSGLFGKPTIINNVETLGSLPNILRNGAAWYRGFGVQGNTGTKTFSLVGSIRRPGLIEVPLGMRLREIIHDIGGGSWKPFKAVQTGGPSGGCLSQEFLDTPVEYEKMMAAGSIMGSGGMIVIDEDTCVVDLALYFLRFTQSESCGKCSPCRVGTWHMVSILERIVAGRGEPEDLAQLQHLAETVARASLCGLGQTAPNPVLTTLRYFRDEYLAHSEKHKCPAGVCKTLIKYKITKECTGCMVCARQCPQKCITGEKKKLHVIDAKQCIKCGICRDVCKFDAVRVS